jgi:hypothetical protein
MRRNIKVSRLFGSPCHKGKGNVDFKKAPHPRFRGFPSPPEGIVEAGEEVPEMKSVPLF